MGSDGGLFQTDGSLFTGKPMGAKWDDSMNAGLSDLLARSIATDFKGQIVSGLQDWALKCPLPRLELEASLAGGFGEGFDPAVIAATAAIKRHGGHPD